MQVTILYFILHFVCFIVKDFFAASHGDWRGTFEGMYLNGLRKTMADFRVVSPVAEIWAGHLLDWR